MPKNKSKAYEMLKEYYYLRPDLNVSEVPQTNMPIADGSPAEAYYQDGNIYIDQTMSDKRKASALAHELLHAEDAAVLHGVTNTTVPLDHNEEYNKELLRRMSAKIRAQRGYNQRMFGVQNPYQDMIRKQQESVLGPAPDMPQTPVQPK